MIKFIKFNSFVWVKYFNYYIIKKYFIYQTFLVIEIYIYIYIYIYTSGLCKNL